MDVASSAPFALEDAAGKVRVKKAVEKQDPLLETSPLARCCIHKFDCVLGDINVELTEVARLLPLAS